MGRGAISQQAKIPVWEPFSLQIRGTAAERPQSGEIKLRAEHGRKNSFGEQGNLSTPCAAPVGCLGSGLSRRGSKLIFAKNPAEISSDPPVNHRGLSNAAPEKAAFASARHL